MHADTDRFFRVQRTVRNTSVGPVELPIAYYDVTNAIAMFWGDRAGAESILADAGLTLAFARGDRALIAMSFYEYRRTTVGVYNEVGLAIFCLPPGERPSRLGLAELYAPPARRRTGAYVVDLPVTTALANAAGRELWGYPKFVTEIPFRLDGREIDTGVRDPDDGSSICTFAGKLGRGLPAPPISPVTFTRLEGTLLRTHVDVRGAVKVCRPGSARLRVGVSQHPMAEHLRTLGLQQSKPLVVFVTDRFQSLLHAGVPQPRAS